MELKCNMSTLSYMTFLMNSIIQSTSSIPISTHNSIYKCPDMHALAYKKSFHPHLLHI